MSITKFYKIVKPDHEAVHKAGNQDVGNGIYGNYTWFHRLVQGSATRLVKYKEYDVMDNDIDVSRSLDIIAEEITGNNPKNKQPLLIHLIDEPDLNIPSRSVVTLKAALRTFCKINDLDKRMFELSRHMVKYGDCFFIRNKNNKKPTFVHAKHVVSAAVAENDITDIKGWYIKSDFQRADSTSPNYNIGGFNSLNDNEQANVQQFTKDEIIRFSLNDEMSPEAPFGVSILRPVYTTFKQKELLEDAILIYRIQRAPERRIFYIDVGRMPPHKISAHLNQIKNEIKQKKIPSQFGGKSQVESIYNPQSMCLALDTKIPLLDGRTLTLNEMIAEHENGKENWVYSINPENGEVAPGVVSWAGITRKNTETITLTLDNGKTITCTPDHKFPVQGKGKVMAKDLTEDDSLFPFTMRSKKIKKKEGEYTTGKYTEIYNPRTKGWKYVHRLVAYYMERIGEENIFRFDDAYIDEPLNTIHHIDYNSMNNSPNNLTFMSHKDHVKYHMFITGNVNVIFSDLMVKIFIELTSKDIYMSFKEVLGTLNDSSDFIDEFTKINPPIKGSKLDPSKIRQKLFLKFIKFVGFKNWKEYQRYVVQRKIDSNDLIDNIGNEWEINDIRLIQFILDKVKTVSIHNYALVNYFKENKIEWNKLLELYSCSNIKSDKSTPGNYRTLNVPESGIFNRISKYFGYNNFKHLVKEAYNFNHRVVKIKKGKMQNVGTLTIDQAEKYHKYHTFALDSGCFTFNSQDFFFAKRSDGSGSSVETLPGGQGLGELSDLEYFYKKMWRAMRIPQSYMSNTMEDGSIDNNGRVGIAYMQEIKFTLYIERLQTYIERVMDEEFKRYLYDIGVNIDPTIYEVTLPAPSDYSQSRDNETNAQLLGTYTQSDGIESLSARFTLRKYLGLTPDEIKENERLKAEELGLDVNADKENLPKIYSPDAAELGGFEGGLGGSPSVGGGEGLDNIDDISDGESIEDSEKTDIDDTTDTNDDNTNGQNDVPEK